MLEAMKQTAYTAWLIATCFEPISEGIEMRADGARAISLQRERPLEKGVQHTALLQ